MQMNLAKQCTDAGWAVLDMWHAKPPRRRITGPFATVTVTPRGVHVEQQGGADWPPCVLELLALWSRDIGERIELHEPLMLPAAPATGGQSRR
jgi:hypothetical protein